MSQFVKDLLTIFSYTTNCIGVVQLPQTHQEVRNMAKRPMSARRTTSRAKSSTASKSMSAAQLQKMKRDLAAAQKQLRAAEKTVKALTQAMAKASTKKSAAKPAKKSAAKNEEPLHMMLHSEAGFRPFRRSITSTKKDKSGYPSRTRFNL